LRPTQDLPGVARRQVTFLVLPRKVTKRKARPLQRPAGSQVSQAPSGGQKNSLRSNSFCPTAPLGTCLPWRFRGLFNVQAPRFKRENAKNQTNLRNIHAPSEAKMLEKAHE
jgi:hypothetical protein